MKTERKQRQRITMWSILAFVAFLLVVVGIPWIRSQGVLGQTAGALDPTDVARNATKLAGMATAEAFPTSQVNVNEVKPLGADETTQTPEATAYAPIPGAQPAGQGAIVEIQPPFPTELYRITNAWYFDDEGGRQRTFVWAGSHTRQGEAEEPGLVIIQVYRRDVAGQEPETSIYDAPEGFNNLRVTGAEGMRITLQSSNDRTLYFDVSTRSFETP